MSTARSRNEMILADLVAARAEEQPDLDVLTFEHLSLDDGRTPDEVRSYAELAENANRLAVGLTELGMEPGDRFGIMMRNHPEFVETMIAASITGTVFVPVDPRSRGEKLAYMLAASGCRGLVTSDECLGEVDRVREGLPDVGVGARARDRRRGAGFRPMGAAAGRAPRARGPHPRRAHRRPGRAAADHVHLRHHRRPEGDRRLQHAVLRSRDARSLLRLRTRRPPLHRALAHPRQLPVGHARPGAEHGPARGLQPSLHTVAAVGGVPGVRVHHLLDPRRDRDRDLQRARRGPTTPRTRCGW